MRATLPLVGEVELPDFSLCAANPVGTAHATHLTLSYYSVCTAPRAGAPSRSLRCTHTRTPSCMPRGRARSQRRSLTRMARWRARAGLAACGPERARTAGGHIPLPVGQHRRAALPPPSHGRHLDGGCSGVHWRGRHAAPDGHLAGGAAQPRADGVVVRTRWPPEVSRAWRHLRGHLAVVHAALRACTCGACALSRACQRCACACQRCACERLRGGSCARQRAHPVRILGPC